MTDTLTEIVPGSDSPDVPEVAGQPDIGQLQGWLNKANKEAAERKQANKQLQAELDALKAERTAASEKALAEQGQYQTLFETEKKRAEAEAARAAELEGRIKTQEIAIMRQQIAAEKGLPSGLAARLRGETADEISADADELLKAIPPVKPQAPILDGRAGGQGGGNVAVSDEEVKAFAARMGISPEHVDKASLARAYKPR